MHSVTSQAQSIDPRKVLESQLWKSYVAQIGANYETTVDYAYLAHSCETHLTEVSVSSFEDGIDLCIATTLAEIDPSGSYDNPSEYKRKQKESQQPFIGIALELRNQKKLGEPLVVVSAIANGPGERAGILPGDKILAADGVALSPLSLTESIAALRGPVGSRVSLSIQRGDAVLELSAVRKEIRVNYVRAQSFDNGAFYCRVSFFRKGVTTSQFFALLKNTLAAQEPNALILDLRNNPGGALEEVTAFASLLVPPNTRLLASVTRPEPEFLVSKSEIDSVQGRTSQTDELLARIPLYVLVNSQTASGAEALALILKQHRGAIVVGSKTAGTNLVQRRLILDGQAAITITTGRLVSASGQSWRDRGVPIDVHAPETNGHEFGTPDDAVLAAALHQMARK